MVRTNVIGMGGGETRTKQRTNQPGRCGTRCGEEDRYDPYVVWYQQQQQQQQHDEDTN